MTYRIPMDTIVSMLYTINFYETESGKIPFEDWLEDQDQNDSDRILVRLNRLQLGNLGQCKPVGNGISELILDTGPGYRIYFSKIGQEEILILNAGTKRTQEKDIKKAKEYFKDYKMRGKDYEKN